jgi:hypothetical protein
MTRTARTLAALLLAPAASLAVEPGATPPGGTAATSPGEIRGTLPPPKLVPVPEGGRPVPRGTVLEEVVGTVREVNRAQHRITIETAGGPVTLSLDRNTLVYGPGGLGTVLDLTPGSPVRAGRNADMMAYWVTVRSPAKTGEPGSVPGQGTGPGGGAGPPAGEGGPATPAPPTSPGPGSTAPGPGSNAPGTGAGKAPATGGTGR